VLRDIKTIAPTGWYGAPEHATVDKGMKMLNDIADAIAKEAGEIFRLLDEAQGGTAEIKHLKVAG
jgi:creatinine amidohydrolase